MSVSKPTSKRGLAWESGPGSHPEDAFQFAGSGKITWAYNWSPHTRGLESVQNVEFIPMQWNAVFIEQLAEHIATHRPAVILGFNEPDLSSQCNMPPKEAAELWKKYIMPLRRFGVRLGAPAVTSAEFGRQWLRDFFACGGCEVDFLSLHWYGDSIGAFYDYVWSMHGEFGKPVWITEFASTSSDDAAVQDFMRQTIQYLDTLDFVERYSWFGGFRQDGKNHYAMMDESGRLNALGHIYMN
ncbi:glycoside hydrolase family 128 protein [Sphaerobolus stellatus SS14]|nr:glycoside hydrolase family 128 protein [Sphaerobolus stellatus SS14]